MSTEITSLASQIDNYASYIILVAEVPGIAGLNIAAIVYPHPLD